MTHKLIENLNAAITDKKASMVIETLEECYQAILTGDLELANTITEPLVITGLHRALNEHLDVHGRTMLLRNRVPIRKQRALMFIKAMQNGVRRTQA